MQEVFEKIINNLEEQKEYYKDIRKNTHCRVTETSECDSCKADHFLDARLRCVDDLIEIVKQADEKYNNGWIPCSERLPNKDEYLKDDGRFIVTDGNRRYQSIYDIYQGKFITLNLYGGWRDYEIDNCAIAWQPLPEPYQPKDC